MIWCLILPNKGLLHISMIDNKTTICGSFAKTAGTFGAWFHNTLANHLGINLIYIPFSVSDIKDAVNAAKTLNFRGFAVTSPYKTEVIKYIDDVSEVSMIGSANTVIIDNGKTKAYNFDSFAAFKMIQRRINRDSLFILGNGGYAKAVTHAAKQIGLKNINFVTRENWDLIPSIRHSLIYNCTPVENIVCDSSNIFVDCSINTQIGKHLAFWSACKQWELYTGIRVKEEIVEKLFPQFSFYN